METIKIQVPSELAQQIRLHRNELPRILELGLHYLATEDNKKLIANSKPDAIQLLAEAGLLTDLGQDLRHRAENSTASLGEVVETMSAAGGKSLSEIVIEQRRAKEW